MIEMTDATVADLGGSWVNGEPVLGRWCGGEAVSPLIGSKYRSRDVADASDPLYEVEIVGVRPVSIEDNTTMYLFRSSRVFGSVELVEAEVFHQVYAVLIDAEETLVRLDALLGT
jgi:hypothetical protein